MFNRIKRFFGFDDGYEDRCRAAIRVLIESENPYDVKLGHLLLSESNHTLNMDEIDRWVYAEGSEKERIRESVNRFLAMTKI